jgi:hypothetical protein
MESHPELNTPLPPEIPTFIFKYGSFDESQSSKKEIFEKLKELIDWAVEHANATGNYIDKMSVNWKDPPVPRHPVFHESFEDDGQPWNLMITARLKRK